MFGRNTASHRIVESKMELDNHKEHTLDPAYNS